MERGVTSTIRTGAALAMALAAAVEARAQLPTVSIDDLRVVEGSSGNWTVNVTVRLSAPSPSPVQVPWHTVDGSAISGPDYVGDANGVTFPSNSTTPLSPLSVTIVGDTTIEWDPTPKMDKAFFVQLDPPTTLNATLLKSRATVTIVDDDRPWPGLQLVSAVADGSPGSGRVRLQWRVPPSTPSGAPTDVLVRWNEGSSCTTPANATSLPVSGEFLISSPPLPTLPATVNPAGETQVFEHLGRPFVKHCYALFAVYSPGGATTEKAVVSATPFDATAPNPVAWAYSTGYPNVVPPTVGGVAVYTVSTDGVVHAMTRGATGGTWPALWNPVALGKPAHNRSPVVPFPYGQRLFVGTEEGEVHAVDGEDGAIAWSRSAAFKNTQLPYTTGAVQGTPAGLFTTFGGTNDEILVGSNAASNTFYMLNPVTGDNITTFSNGLMGGVPGMPVVDYVGNRTYFLTTLAAGVLWAFDLGPAGAPGLTPSTLPGGNPVNLTYGSNGSPVFGNGLIYGGVTNGDIIFYRPSDGKWGILGGANGEVKGFVFPDRRAGKGGYIYFSTNTYVWSLSVDPAAANPMLTYRWRVTDIPNPSIVLHRPGTRYLYVGGSDGRLYQIDVDSGDPPSKTSVLLEAGSWIGAPSLDGPNNLALVGSSTGVVYAVRVPF